MRINTTDLIDFLPGRRWFTSDRPITDVTVADQAVIDEDGSPLVLALLDVAFADGGEAMYQMPLIVGDDGSVTDATEDVERLRPLGMLLAHGDTIRGLHGSFRFGGPGLDPLSPPGRSSVRAVGAEQSNSSIVLDESVILKIIRRLEIGTNPELELSRFLTNAGFEHIPAQVGEIFYERADDDREVNIDLGIAQQFVTDAVDGWEETLTHVRSLYDSADDAEEIEPVVAERADEILEKLGDLGNVTAALHVVFARGDEAEPDIGAEPVTSVDLKDWIDRALGALVDVREPEAGLAGYGEAVEARLEAMRNIAEPGLKTRIHGDYHLGQTMLNAKGWLILDFEGEPLRSLEERREKHSPLRDVAGMLRSFSYAAYAMLFERTEPDSEEWKRLEPWAKAWEEAARDRFLQNYLRTSHEGDFLPSDRDELGIMLDAFEVDKALYELHYEMGHRPEWLRIPQRGIADVIERGGYR